MKAKIVPRLAERTALKDVVPLDTPFILGIWTGDVCNFKCNYCFQGLPNEVKKGIEFKSTLLDWETFLLIANQTKEFKRPIKKVLFTSMGEPLIHKRLPDMIQYMKDIHTCETIEVITNGSLLDKEMSDRLIHAGLDRINISVQGITNQSYEELCGYHMDMEKFVEQVQYFYENKKQCLVYVKTLDVCLRNQKDGEEAFYGMFGNISDEIHIDKVVRTCKEIDFDSMVETESVNIAGITCSPHKVCSYPFYSLYVQSDGNIVPCCAFPVPGSLGNVRQKKLTEVFCGEIGHQFFRQQLEGRRWEDPICKECTYVDRIAFEEDNLDSYTKEILARL